MTNPISHEPYDRRHRDENQAGVDHWLIAAVVSRKTCLTAVGVQRSLAAFAAMHTGT